MAVLIARRKNDACTAHWPASISLHSQNTQSDLTASWHQSLHCPSEEPWHSSFKRAGGLPRGWIDHSVTRASNIWRPQQCVHQQHCGIASSWPQEHNCISKPLTLWVHHCRWACQLNGLSENLMLNIEHFQWLIIASRMKCYFDSQFYSDGSGPTGEIIRAIHTLKTDKRFSLSRPGLFTIEWGRWLLITQCQINTPSNGSINLLWH